MNNTSTTSLEKIQKQLNNLDSRISSIEEHLKIRDQEEKFEENLISLKSSEDAERNEKLEFHIGQFWFAKAGIVALVIGIVFLLLLPYQSLPSIVPSLLGYLIVGIIFTISYFSKKSFSYLSSYLLGGGLILLFFTTLRLHYFSLEAAVASNIILLILLLIVTFLSLVLSIRNKSIFLTSVSLTFGYATALSSESSYTILLLITLFAIIAAVVKIKLNWNSVFIYGIILTYFSHLNWMINNPIFGNKLLLVGDPLLNVVFLLFTIIIFSLGNLLREKGSKENSIVIISGLLSLVLGYGLFLLNILIKHQSEAVLFNIVAAIVFLSISITFWISEKSKYSTFLFAIFGYLALSTAIVLQFNKPDYFIWLSWQSLIVISTAVWFRSKIIIVANFIIFILVFISYLLLSSDVSFVSIGFGIVALISARLLNWRKYKLELQTEMMRNSYLTTAFIIIPYAFYNFIPREYVSISWIGVSAFYFLLSVLLNNKKYRWMAILTLILTILYISLIGITQLTPIFRVISFLALGIVLIIISILYAKKKNKNGIEKSEYNEN